MNRQIEQSEPSVSQPLHVRGEVNLPTLLTPTEIAALVQFFELLDAWDRKGQASK
jgi:hypothetical protein